MPPGPQVTGASDRRKRPAQATGLWVVDPEPAKVLMPPGPQVTGLWVVDSKPRKILFLKGIFFLI
jgi:hypothetical protein